MTDVALMTQGRAAILRHRERLAYTQEQRDRQALALRDAEIAYMLRLATFDRELLDQVEDDDGWVNPERPSPEELADFLSRHPQGG